MQKHLKAIFMLLFFAAVMSAPLLAQDTELSDNRTSVMKWSLIVGGAIIALAAAAGAYCQAKSISSACVVIYTLLISIIILMVNWGNI